MRYRSLLVLALIALGSCRSREAPAPAPSANVPELEAPSSLVAEVSLGNPKETWRLVRALGGDAAQALPSRLPVLLTTSLSLPPAAASSLDESLPVVGVLLARPDTAEPDAVIGMHVLNGAELVASLTLGDGAKFRRVELGPKLHRLIEAPGAPSFDGALGVSGNYLLIATRFEALKDAGRFVAEVVSTRPTTEPGLLLRTGDRVLKGALSKSLRERWRAQRSTLAAQAEQAREKKGRVADFANPEALLSGADSTVEAFLGVVESSRELSLAIAPETDRVRLELSLLPGTEGPAALLAQELVLGSVAPLWDLPGTARAALLLRGDAQPQGGASWAESVRQLFGERLSTTQATELTETLDAFARAHRGATAVALVATPQPRLAITMEAPDPVAFSRGLERTLRLAELGPLKQWLAGTVGKPSLSFTPSKTPGSGQAQLRFDRNSGSPVPSVLQVTWEARADGVARIIVGTPSAAPLAAFEAEETLGTPWLAKSQPELAGRAALALFVESQLFAPGGPDDAPLVLMLGKRGERVALGIDVAPGALRAVTGLLR